MSAALIVTTCWISQRHARLNLYPNNRHRAHYRYGSERAVIRKAFYREQYLSPRNTYTLWGIRIQVRPQPRVQSSAEEVSNVSVHRRISLTMSIRRWRAQLAIVLGISFPRPVLSQSADSLPPDLIGIARLQLPLNEYPFFFVNRRNYVIAPIQCDLERYLKRYTNMEWNMIGLTHMSIGGFILRFDRGILMKEIWQSKQLNSKTNVDFYYYHWIKTSALK